MEPTSMQIHVLAFARLWPDILSPQQWRDARRLRGAVTRLEVASAGNLANGYEASRQ